jgi:E3 ubiquitin-protein ligase listerin
MNPLLEFTFGFLERSHGKLVDASKMDIRLYEPGQAETRREDMEWLLVHLYFLAAKFLPTLTKNWWIDSKKRIKGPVETWTQRFVSLSWGCG